jgi:hypothetical protein
MNNDVLIADAITDGSDHIFNVPFPECKNMQCNYLLKAAELAGCIMIYMGGT